MGILSATIRGTAVNVQQETQPTWSDQIETRGVLTFTVIDSPGTAFYYRGDPVVLTDSVTGAIYRGYVQTDDPVKQSPDPTQTTILHAITCMDTQYLFDKRTNNVNYINAYSGDIAVDLVRRIGSAEGVTMQAAMDRDTTQSDFAAGTLSGTVATVNTTDGDLELATAGVTVSIQEDLTADFSSGTLTNMVASGNALVPTTVNALKMQSMLSFAYGTEFAQSQQTASGSINVTASTTGAVTPSGYVSISGGTPGESATFSGAGSYVTLTGTASGLTSIPVTQSYQPKTKSKVKIDATHYGIITVDKAAADNRVDATIWTGSYTVGTNDTLNYDIWIASTSPSQEGGVDLYFNDGTTLTQYLGTLGSNTDVGIWDQNLVSVSPIQDLADYAKDAWYTRHINLSALAGKVITSVSIFNAANIAGVFDLYIKNCYLGSQSGSPFFGTSQTTPSVNPPTVSSIGAYITTATIVTTVAVYTPATSSRISPAYSIDAVKLVKSSLVTWTANVPAIGPGVIAGTPGAAATAGQEVLFVSYDGTSWLLCTDNQPLPGLPAGANVAGTSLYLLETFSGGQDPTAIPSLLNVTITLVSAANATTTDSVSLYGSTSTWNSGTELGAKPNTNGDLILGPTSYSWADLSKMTWAPGGNPTRSTSSGAYIITSPGSLGTSWSSSRFNFITAAQNFTADADFTLNGGASPVQNEIGFVYRQTYWGSPNNSFAYYVRVMQAPGGQAGGTSVTLGYGINNLPSANVGGGPASGTFTIITQATVTITNSTTYHVKLVVGQNRHTIYWNNGATPIIDVLDNTYTAAGNIGLRTYAQSTNSTTNKIANFVVTNTFAGLWTSPSINLNSLGTCGNTQIAWSEVTAPGTVQATAVVMASLDGGSTWKQCTNGAISPATLIPGLPVGTNVTGKSLKIQIILSAIGFLVSPIISGLSVRVCGAYPTVTGTRVSPVLSLSPAGRVAASSVSWNATLPNNTSLVVATSPDNITYTTIAASGNPIAAYYAQPAPRIDAFTLNTSANYTSAFLTGGSVATWTYDTTNRRVTATGGSGAVYYYTGLSRADVDLLCDMDESDAGGLVWRFVSSNNYYELGVYDDHSSGGYTNQLRLYKVASGTRSLLGSASTISFARSTSGVSPYHRIRVTMVGGLITVYFDGTVMQTYTDGSPLAAGVMGLRNDGGTSRYYQLRLQPLGDSVSGANLYTKLTLSTTDPSVMPQVLDLTASVRGPGIATGALIPQLHDPTKPFAEFLNKEMDTITSASGDYLWNLAQTGALTFTERHANPAPWCLSSLDFVYDASAGSNAVTPSSVADLYRNRQQITNCLGLTIALPPEQKITDGTATSWTVAYPVYSAPTITLNGVLQTVGVKGVDMGKAFYWQAGNNTISQDTGAVKLPAGLFLTITYIGQYATTVQADNAAEQTARALVETGTSGIVEAIEDGKGMLATLAATYAQGLLARYGNNGGIQLVATTQRQGLTSGMIVPVFLPEHGLMNRQMLVTIVNPTIQQKADGTILYLNKITATEGANLANWTNVFNF